ncbi:MAG: hypothetical protein CUN54_05520 [Phototrophicales bacterium]|nr:MAG: hypothetical protein CUN54_05520 [Phototrophicales bacterium]
MSDTYISTMTRRQFLQFSSVALLSTYLPEHLLTTSPPNVAEDGLLAGRTFKSTSVYSFPRETSDMVEQLWPDSVHPIIGQTEHWYHIPQGYVPRRTLQPMLQTTSSEIPDSHTPPFWAEVATPVAPIYQWCSVEAPLITRIGHGGIMRVVDRIVNTNRWYGLAEADGQFLGWAQALHWQRVTSRQSTQPVADYEIAIDVGRQQLNLLRNQELILQAAISTSPLIVPGRFTIAEQITGGTRLNINQDTYHGVPSVITLNNGQQMTGVYWHNAFGQPVDGPAIQLPYFLASWLANLATFNSAKVMIK